MKKLCGMILGGSLLLLSIPAQGQEAQESNPNAALTAALVAACRQSDGGFARYLTAESAEAFRQLPSDQRISIMKRFVAMADPGRPLLSSDAQNRTIVRCETPSFTGEIRIGKERVQENLAFIPVEIVGGRSIQMGMVREGGGWRILSLGLLLVNVPELAKQWAAADLDAREASAITLLRQLADAVRNYREAFGHLPERLDQLGPAGKEGVSPEKAQLVDEQLAAGEEAGYRFRYRIVPATGEGEQAFELAATPLDYGKSGRRSFFLDAQGRLRGADKQGAVATVSDPLVESGKRD